MLFIGISGSPRAGGNTARLVKHILGALADQGATTEFYSLAETRVGPCTACETCMRDGHCPVGDDFNGLLERVLAADGLVLGSPHYAFAMSAQMKALFDRSHSLLYYTRRLAGKYGVGVAAGGHPFRTAAVAKMLAQGTWLCGGYNLGAVWGVSTDRDLPKLENEAAMFRQAANLARRLYRAVHARKRFCMQDFMRSFFLDRNLRKMVATKKNRYPFLYSYYVTRGWVGNGRGG
jgi:multimeric flavodoxin WrbA